MYVCTLTCLCIFEALNNYSLGFRLLTGNPIKYCLPIFEKLLLGSQMSKIEAIKEKPWVHHRPFETP